MRQPEFYSAVFWIIRNPEWKILFQRRLNTGFMDGWYQMPSGHLEGTETMQTSLVREMKEEIGIEVIDCKLVHISHRVSPDRVYFDIYFEVTWFTWSVENLEPEKCSELVWLDISSNTPNIVNLNLEILERIQQGLPYSEQ